MGNNEPGEIARVASSTNSLASLDVCLVAPLSRVEPGLADAPGRHFRYHINKSSNRYDMCARGKYVRFFAFLYTLHMKQKL